MPQIYTLTEAKAKLSELIGKVHFGNEKFTITRKGKAVAAVLPITESTTGGRKEGLIRAKGALQETDEVVDELIDTIYKNRKIETDRQVNL